MTFSKLYIIITSSVLNKMKDAQNVGTNMKILLFSLFCVCSLTFICLQVFYAAGSSSIWTQVKCQNLQTVTPPELFKSEMSDLMQKTLNSKEENTDLVEKINGLINQVKSLDRKIENQEHLLKNQEKLLTEKKNLEVTSSISEPIEDLFPEHVRSVWINVGPHKSPIIPPEGFGLVLVEPNYGIYKKLVERFDGDKDKIIINAAISNDVGVARFGVMGPGGQSGSLSKPKDPTRKWAKEVDRFFVPVLTLRHILDMIPANITIEFLKTDMQGHDLNAIKSAGESLKRVRKSLHEVSADGKETYADTDNFKSSWFEYMEKMKFDNEWCKKNFKDKNLLELDCQFINSDV